MGGKMDVDEYVRRQNLELYRKLLAECPADDPRKEVLVRLLADEKAGAAVKGTKRGLE
jgi:phage terminase Nu1 subunit (DNA packaging protein)